MISRIPQPAQLTDEVAVTVVSYTVAVGPPLKQEATAVEVEVHSVIGLQGMPQLGAALARAITVVRMERVYVECMVVVSYWTLG